MDLSFILIKKCLKTVNQILLGNLGPEILIEELINLENNVYKVNSMRKVKECPILDKSLIHYDFNDTKTDNYKFAVLFEKVIDFIVSKGDSDDREQVYKILISICVEFSQKDGFSNIVNNIKTRANNLISDS